MPSLQLPAKGIDISIYQRGLDLKQAAAAGYKFAILRAGYTGYGANRTKQADFSFAGFCEQAKAIQMPVGAYWYSCADSTSQAVAEAKHCLSVIGNRELQLPVYIDVEDPTWQQNKKTQVTDAAIAFCETVEAAGHAAGVYASLDWFNNHLQTSRLAPYTKWVAAWGSNNPKLNQPGWAMWQNSSTAKIGAYTVDTNIAYPGLPTAKPAANPASPQSSSTQKPLRALNQNEIQQWANRVIAGEFGNEPARTPKLQAALAKNGISPYQSAQIQAYINQQQRAQQQKYYIVQPGDTLSAIAAKYGTTWQQLAQINKLANPNLIHPGQKILVE